MRRPTRRLTAAGLAATLLLPLGCASSDPDPGRRAAKEPEYVPPPRPDARLDIEFDLAWEDIDINDRGEPDPIEVARWRKERSNAAIRCLNHDPPALLQAIEILEAILDRVPQSSKDRGLVAQCYFDDARYWWLCADVVAYEMSWIQHRGTLREADGTDGRVLTEEEVERLLADMKPYLEKANKQLRAVARKALRHFRLYRQQRPDDKSVFDFYWKLHFYLQNYEESLRWLEQVIHEMDLAEVPEGDETRERYEEIRGRLRDYLAERRIHGAGEVEEGRPSGILGPLDRSAGRGSYDY